MKKTLLVLGGIGFVCVLLVARLFSTQHSSMEQEREWFAEAVRYEFSATVDSVQMINVNNGRLYCRVTSGDPKSNREDSLKRLFKEHDMLYLIFKQSGDSIVFILPENGKFVLKGDSVRVSSSKNTIQFFRDGKEVINGELSSTLTGFGRPFFMKK
jgi:hypothetical protein